MANILRHDIDNTAKILKNDQSFQSIVIVKNNISLTDSEYNSLAVVLLENKKHILENNINDLINENPPFLRTEFAEIYNKQYITEEIYRQTLYTFKYSSIRTFFKDNYKHFVPDYDLLNIRSQEKTLILQEAFMREFDRFTDTIDKIYDIVDVDKVPDEYLNYLAQVIGYEREDSELLPDASFRELIKNIIEIYRIKGTNYSFELFFNFLGFEVTLKEFWFDKRLGDMGIASNPYTGTSNRNHFSFYLTPFRPTDYIPENMINPYSVTEDELIETLDLNEFTEFAEESLYSPNQLLGNSLGFQGRHYTYFKTNVMEYSLQTIQADESADEEDISPQDIQIIQRYADFLTPIFIQRNIVVIITPFEDFLGILALSDSARSSLLSPNPLVNRESFFRLYIGYQPTFYFSEDGVRLYDDPVPNDLNVRWSELDIEPGGLFVSGKHDDTTEKIYDTEEDSESVYDSIRALNPDITHSEIMQQISTLISTRKLFYEVLANGDIEENYAIRNRDLLYPILEAIDGFLLSSLFNMITDFSIGTPLKLSFSDDGFLIDGNGARFSKEENPFSETELFNIFEIKSIIANDGNDNALITIRDDSRKLEKLQLFNSETEDRLFGDFTTGSEWIENVEYNLDIAPQHEENTLYEVGNFVRHLGVVYRCITTHTSGTFPGTVFLAVNWIEVNGISLIKEGDKLYKPNTIFDIDILEVDVLNKRIRISSPVAIDATEFHFSFTSSVKNIVDILGTINPNNSGIYKIKELTFSSNIVDVVNYNNEAIIKIDSALEQNQITAGGFVILWKEPWKIKNFRFPFLFDVIKPKATEMFFYNLGAPTSWVDFELIELGFATDNFDTLIDGGTVWG